MPKELGKDEWLAMLAVWLNGAAHDLGQHDLLRRIVRRASETAASLYVIEGDDPEDEDDTGNMDLLATFATALDEDERTRKQMESP
jgi:hypothetical protein